MLLKDGIAQSDRVRVANAASSQRRCDDPPHTQCPTSLSASVGVRGPCTHTTQRLAQQVRERPTSVRSPGAGREAASGDPRPTVAAGCRCSSRQGKNRSDGRLVVGVLGVGVIVCGSATRSNGILEVLSGRYGIDIPRSSSPLSPCRLYMVQREDVGVVVVRIVGRTAELLWDKRERHVHLLVEHSAGKEDVGRCRGLGVGNDPDTERQYDSVGPTTTASPACPWLSSSPTLAEQNLEQGQEGLTVSWAGARTFQLPA